MFFIEGAASGGALSDCVCFEVAADFMIFFESAAFHHRLFSHKTLLLVSVFEFLM